MHENIWYESELLASRLQRLYDCGLAACGKIEGLGKKCYDEIEESVGVRVTGELKAIEILVKSAFDKIEKEERIEWYWDLQSLEFKIDTRRRIEAEAEPDAEPVVVTWGEAYFNEGQLEGVKALLGGDGEMDVEDCCDILNGLGNDGCALPVKWAAMSYNDWYEWVLGAGGEVGGTVEVGKVLEGLGRVVEEERGE